MSQLLRLVARLEKDIGLQGNEKSERALTDEGIIEGCEDAGDAKNKFACCMGLLESKKDVQPCCLPSRTWGPREMFSVAARSTFFLGGMLEEFRVDSLRG